MCISKETLNERMAEIQQLKRLREETDDAIKALERDVIEFLLETAECETTDKKGNIVHKFIGTTHKATYSPQTRETVDKTAVKLLLSDEDYLKVSKVSTYQVLRIS